MSKTAAERQQAYRDKKRNAPKGYPSVNRYVPGQKRNAPEVTPEDAPQSTNSGAVVAEHPAKHDDDYISNHDRYNRVPRMPDVVKPGQRTRTREIEDAVVKAMAGAGDSFVGRTRLVPIPGDADYVGCCKEVGGVWVVQPDHPEPISSLSDIDLQLRLKSYPGASWVNTPEHKEVLRRRAVA